MNENVFFESINNKLKRNDHKWVQSLGAPALTVSEAIDSYLWKFSLNISATL